MTNMWPGGIEGWGGLITREGYGGVEKDNGFVKPREGDGR